MHAALVSSVALVALSGLAVALPGADVLVAHSVRQLAKRAATPAQSSYLSDIFGMVTTRCESTCNVGLEDLTACSNLSNQATIAACACSSVTLADLRACASCVSTTTRSTKNETAVVNSYNSFVDLCTEEGLAQVTGTVEVGASTKALSRTATLAAASATRALAAASGSASASTTVRSTYNPAAAPISTASVPALIASGSIASSARSVASSQAAASQSAVSQVKTSGAGRLAGQAFAAVAAAVVGVAVLA
ncbi:hypothetical protein JCM10450v2_007422 [Rhodotorula kratochvilovae]